MNVYALKVRPKNHPFPILAWLIMIVEGMNPFDDKAYSHNAIIYTVEDLMFVIDATTKSVRIVSDKTFFKTYKLIDMRELPSSPSDYSFYKWISSILGRDYDRLQLVGLLMGKLGLVKRSKLGSNYKKMICSEVIMHYLDTFTDLEFGDSDSYDLNEVWDIVVSL